jgi:hypothetical protein
MRTSVRIVLLLFAVLVLNVAAEVAASFFGVPRFVTGFCAGVLAGALWLETA